MEILNKVLIPALAIIATGLASWAVSALVAWLNTKIKNEKIRAALKNARDIINAAVLETSQTFVDDLKKSGNFTDALKSEAFAKTLENVKSQLTAEGVSLIQETTTDVEAWIRAEIEKAVKNNKQGG